MILKIFSGLLIVCLLSFVVMAFVALGTECAKTMKYSVGWVWQGKNGSAVKEFLIEEGGCINYIDVWDKKSKACGEYIIERY